MDQALERARTAYTKNEVPVGAIVINRDGVVIGEGYNQVESQKTQCAHAEMIAIQQAAKKIGDWRLDGCTIYVTLEPCSMCFSLIRLSRLSGLVYAAPSLRFGYHLDNVANSQVYKKGILILEGIKKEESEQLLKQFFQNQRVKKGEYVKSRSEKDQRKIN